MTACHTGGCAPGSARQLGPAVPSTAGPSPFPHALSAVAGTIPPTITRHWGDTMRRTILPILAACLALAGCSSSTDDKPPAKATATVTATPSAAPSLSQAETKRLCSVDVAEAAPAWEDWNFSPGEWQDDPRTPEVCLGLADEEFPPRGNREFMDALIAGLEMADDPRARQ